MDRPPASVPLGPSPALAIDRLNHRPPSPAPAINNINPLLLASACSGDLKGLNMLLNAQDEESAFEDLLLLPVYGASRTKPAATSQGRAALRLAVANNDGDNDRFSICDDHTYDLSPAYDRFSVLPPACRTGTTPESVLEGVVTSQGNTNCDGGYLLSSSSNLIYDLLPAYAAAGSSTTPEKLLEGVTVEGDTALHAVASNGDGDNFLSSADLIYSKAEHLLFVQNKWGETPLHLAVRAGNYRMVVRLIALAKEIIATASGGATRVKTLLETENQLKETVLHEAVRIGSDDMVKLLMKEDPELARFPKDGTSPLYLAVLLKKKIIAETLYMKSGRVLSYSGPNKQNTLHAAVGTCPDLAKLVLEWKKNLTTEKDEKGSTPLHFAAGLLQPGTICGQLLEANPAALYQSDEVGLFPIHVAASVGADGTIAMFVNKCPSSAGLRDAKGRTFLHVAVEEKRVLTVKFACTHKSLSWILNMRDKNGNTALHLAVQGGSLRMVSALLMSLHVQLNLTNDKGHTPLDIAVYKIPPGLYHGQSSGANIRSTLKMAGARNGVSRKDHKNYEDRKGPEMIKDSNEESERTKDSSKELERIKNTSKGPERTKDSSKESERIKNASNESEWIKEATQNLNIVSVVIATVAFGATFTLPGGYRADDHLNGGSPTRAGRYAFDAFMMANTLSFICSTIATMGFMYSGSSMVDMTSRRYYFVISVYLMRTSISSLTTAFALGVYLVLAPVALMTTIAICVLSSLVVLSTEVEVWLRRFFILRPLYIRNGLAWTIRHELWAILLRAGFIFWPVILIFVWAGIARMHWHWLASLLHF